MPIPTKRNEVGLAVLLFLLLVALACVTAPARSAETSAGVLWSTHTGVLPNLYGSLLLAEYHEWEVWGDLFVAVEDIINLDLKVAGAGASVAAPPGTPIISSIMDVLNADRGGLAGHYDFRAEEWGLSVYVIHEF